MGVASCLRQRARFGWEGAEVNLHRSGDIQLSTPPAGFITRPRTLLGFFFFLMSEEVYNLAIG